MPVTNTKESGLEALIVSWLTERNGFEEGSNADYNKEYAVDEARFFRFLQETQGHELKKLNVESPQERRKLLKRVSDEVSRRGIVDVLRNGVKAYPARLNMYYLTPTQNNADARALFAKNIFSVTRQLRYSSAEGNLALDLCVFINGLPIITFELKNTLTKQNVDKAVEQYCNDRSPRDALFSFKRCMVHFAVDDARVKFCTKLEGKESFFLPFDKGYNDGAGNPPNPDGLMTDYLWKDILTKEKLALIIENYAQVVAEPNAASKKGKEKQIFPRFHQLDVVTRLLADVRKNGIGKRYLIEHSAGSGKSNSIAWLAHQLAGLEQGGRPMIDSVIVVTDRRVLDRQIRDTVKQFVQVAGTVVWAEHSADLLKAIADGKRIIVTTIEKFPYIAPEIGAGHKDRRFAIIIDEAHSGMSGRNSASMNVALSAAIADSEMDSEDKINAMMEGRKLLKNASYFAFTATPKNKTLETFGTPFQEDGKTKRRPFHVYTMKQAIQEGFILDVLQNYTAIDTFYKLIKTAEDDPFFEKAKAQKMLRGFVEGHEAAIAKKAAIMVEHFHGQVIGKRMIDGKARAMVVTSSIERCIEYYRAINSCLQERQSPYKAIIAFSGEHKTGGEGAALTSASLNTFSDAEIPAKFRNEPYRFLVVAEMFQTGFDEPLLHTMYVDKPLSGIKAVQTLSRLNRCHPKKHDTFILDFANTAETIKEAFAPYYRATILSEETDPNKLNDLADTLQRAQVFSQEEVRALVKAYLDGEPREKLDPILDSCAERYKALETKDEQIRFKRAAKSFCRAYSFLAAILPFGNADWERLSIFLNLLIPKLPAPLDDDLTPGILELVDLESYRNEARAAVSITLDDNEGKIDPVPPGLPGGQGDPELEKLSALLEDFNTRFGNISWNDKDNVERQLREIPAMVSKNEKYQNAMRNSDEQNARIESDNALHGVILSIMQDNMELFKQFQDNASFKEWLSAFVFSLTYNKDGRPYTPAEGSSAKTYHPLLPLGPIEAADFKRL